MFVRSRNFILSTLVHGLLVLPFLLFYRQQTSQLPLPVPRRIVSVHIDRVPRKAVSLPPSVPAVPVLPIPSPGKPSDPVTAPKETEPERVRENPATSVPDTEPEKPLPVETPVNPTDIPMGNPVEEEPPGADFSYSYKTGIPVTFDNAGAGVDVPVEDFLIDDLLITENESAAPGDALYTIELEEDNSRVLLDTPELFLDLSDPVLGTLLDCRVRFTVSREGLVRDISMIPPGTGSDTYDEILENIVSRFVFSPGENENGVIGIQFSKFYGEAFD